MPNVDGKYVSGHLKNKLSPMKPKAGAGGKETIEAHKPGDGVSLEKPVNEPTQPHTMTGVHKVEIAHHGGGRYSTHTHHDAAGQQVDSMDHASAEEAHAKAQEDLPGEMAEQGEIERPDNEMGEGMESLGEAI